VSVILYYRVQDNFCRPISQYIVFAYFVAYVLFSRLGYNEKYTHTVSKYKYKYKYTVKSRFI